MASTQYKTNVEMFMGVPFTNEYSHTLSAMSKDDKLTWLRNNCFPELESTFANHDSKNIMYFKLDSSNDTGILRLRCPNNHAYMYNYAYVNNGVNNRWFCFVTGCRYINDANSPGDVGSYGIYEFDLELDVLMTNILSDNQLGATYVVRTHPLAESIGSNRVPDFNCDHYVCNDRPSNQLRYGGDFQIILQRTDSAAVSGKLYDGNYSGCYLWTAPLNHDHTSDINTEIGSSRPEDIIDLYVVPRLAVDTTDNVEGPTGNLADNDLGNGQNWTAPALTNSTTLDGYEVNNLKLLTYPYNMLTIDTGDGSNMVLAYEDFENGTPKIRIDTAILKPVTMVAYPVNYKGIKGDVERPAGFRYIKENLTWKPLPNCSYSYDGFQQWLATTGVNSLIGAITGMATGNTGAGLTSAFSGVGDVVSHAAYSSFYKSSEGIFTNPVVGKSEFSNALSNKLYGFWVTRVSLNNTDARTVDRYFTRYGYAQNRVINVSTNARKYFTYVEIRDECYSNFTVRSGLTQEGCANARQINKINSALRKGVTFWTANTTNQNIFDYDALAVENRALRIV